jgi:hypothetical protein
MWVLLHGFSNIVGLKYNPGIAYTWTFSMMECLVVECGYCQSLFRIWVHSASIVCDVHGVGIIMGILSHSVNIFKTM